MLCSCAGAHLPQVQLDARKRAGGLGGLLEVLKVLRDLNLGLTHRLPHARVLAEDGANAIAEVLKVILQSEFGQN